ncbi:MAG: hypothetical protein ABJQ71_22485 [Roseibium sp.]
MMYTEAVYEIQARALEDQKLWAILRALSGYLFHTDRLNAPSRTERLSNLDIPRGT